MRTCEIARSEWKSFADTFSRQHEGWLVSIAEETHPGEHEWLARDLPLHGVAAEISPTDGEIFVFAGGVTPHLSHAIAHPASVTVEETDDGAQASLMITDVDGARTFVEFRSPMRSELVDGMAPQEVFRR